MVGVNEWNVHSAGGVVLETEHKQKENQIAYR